MAIRAKEQAIIWLKAAQKTAAGVATGSQEPLRLSEVKDCFAQNEQVTTKLPFFNPTSQENKTQKEMS